jgi:hypothetical protein
MLLANRHNQRSAIRKNLLSIDKSHEALSQHEQQRLARLRTTGWQSLSQTACITVISELDATKAVLSDLLVPEAIKDLQQLYTTANNYLFFQVSEEKYCVKNIHWESFDPKDPVTR